MKITVLTFIESEKAKSHDIVVDQMAQALRQGKHEVSVLGVHGDLKKLIAGLARRKPQLIFNLLVMFGTNVRGDVAVAGVLELLGYRFTGGGSGELYLQQDKALAMNANCYLEQFSEFATAAAAAGLDYPALVGRIVELAVERHQVGI